MPQLIPVRCEVAVPVPNRAVNNTQNAITRCDRLLGRGSRVEDRGWIQVPQAPQCRKRKMNMHLSPEMCQCLVELWGRGRGERLQTADCRVECSLATHVQDRNRSQRLTLKFMSVFMSMSAFRVLLFVASLLALCRWKQSSCYCGLCRPTILKRFAY